MNFAPYQDEAPESERAPTPRLNTASEPSTSASAIPTTQTPFYDDDNEDIDDPLDFLPDPASFDKNKPDDSRRGGVGAGGRRFLGFGNRRDVERRLGVIDDDDDDLFATSLPMRLDVEAVLCYVGLPPVAGAVLLCLETKSDYVRFHAWQSSLLFTFLFLIHLIFSFSKVISYTLLAVDLVAIAFLALHAYRDADTLERWQVPLVGRLASSFVDQE